jgi:hypothetical protein
VDNISGALLTATADLPPNTSIKYYLSNNGGSRWFLVHPGEHSRGMLREGRGVKF